MPHDRWEAYFRELCTLLDDDRDSPIDTGPYRRLLWKLHNTEFRASMRMDENRLGDAADFRNEHFGEYLDKPIGMLEMMLSLAKRLEVEIMHGTIEHDRTAHWFWKMVESLGLSGMTDGVYDEIAVSKVLKRFIRRGYSPSGRGGLFTISDPRIDMRRQEIWYQANLYLNDVLRFEGFIEP